MFVSSKCPVCHFVYVQSVILSVSSLSFCLCPVSVQSVILFVSNLSFCLCPVSVLAVVLFCGHHVHGRCLRYTEGVDVSPLLTLERGKMAAKKKTNREVELLVDYVFL